MLDESAVYAVIGWITCERARMKESRYGRAQYPYVAGYMDCLDFVEERLQKAFKDCEPEVAERLPDGSGRLVSETCDG